MGATKIASVSKPRVRVRANGASKPRVRVKAGRRPQAYLRDTGSGVISTRPAVLVNSRDAIRRAWQRSAGLASDLVQNSGRLSGASDQVIADTVGSELMLAPIPDAATLRRLGYDEKERADLILLIKNEWKWWSWNPSECDYRGKLTVPQMVDIGLRWDMSFGEILQVLQYMPPQDRIRYGVKTGLKVMMVPPNRLVQDTSAAEGMFQGVVHDTYARPSHYRFQEWNSGVSRKVDYPAFDTRGHAHVVHIFDSKDAEDVRGISRLAPAFRKHIQHEMLDDATVQTSILQTIFAATLTSGLPSAEAFEAINAMGSIEDDGSTVADEFSTMFSGMMARALNGGIDFSTDPSVSHLAPGEEFKIHGTATPGPHYQSLSSSLDREMARAIGITASSFTLDNKGETYSSSRVGFASIWPVVVRRRERISGMQSQSIYEAFLDEAIGTGRIPLKGGYRAFLANRDKLSWAQWRGPAKPSADDDKSAKASGRRLENKTTTLEIESADLGHPADELFEQQVVEHKKYLAEGMASPYSLKLDQSPQIEIAAEVEVIQ